MVLRWAFGPLKLKPKEFWKLSWAEFWAIYEGHELKRQVEIWDPARFLAAEIRNASYHRGKKSYSAQEVLHLPLVDRTASYAEKETPEQIVERIAKSRGKDFKLYKG